MSSNEHFDIVVFGGGKAGKTLAMDRAKAGKKVAVIEAGLIGGSCINIACIPSKTLIRSASVVHASKNMHLFGVKADNIQSNLEMVRDRTAKVVAEMVATNQAGFDASGFELVLGWGRFIAPKTIEVEGAKGPRRISGDQVFINLGTKADVPNIPGLIEANPITHVEALQLGQLPTRLIVIGGGYIGLELGQAFQRLGSEVVILERAPRLATKEDPDVSQGILDVLQAEGMQIELNIGDLNVTGRSGEAVKVTSSDGRVFEGSHILVAAGRKPQTEGIGLALAGVETDPRGFIKVDEHLRTTAPDVWAMGEVAGTPMFTHASLDDYRVVMSQMAGGTRSTKDRSIPYCVFIDPEFARIGLNETEARLSGIDYQIAKLPMDVIPRARTLSERSGFMKAIVASGTGKVLGFSMLGVNAGEVMTAVQMGMAGGLDYKSFRDAIYAHPTISEGLNMLFAALKTPEPVD